MGIQLYFCNNKICPKRDISQKLAIYWHGMKCVLKKIEETGKGEDNRMPRKNSNADK